MNGVDGLQLSSHARNRLNKPDSPLSGGEGICMRIGSSFIERSARSYSSRYGMTPFAEGFRLR